MTVINDNLPKKEDWTAASLVASYHTSTGDHTREIHITLEEIQEEQRDKAREQGATPEQVESIVLDAGMFQGFVYQAARQLATSPIFHKEDGANVRVLGPWHIQSVEVIPQKRNKILTPTQTLHVPKQRTN